MRCAYTTGLGEVLVINRITQGALHHLNEPLSLTMGLDYSTSPPVILMGRSGPLRSLSRSNVFPFGMSEASRTSIVGSVKLVVLVWLLITEDFVRIIYYIYV